MKDKAVFSVIGIKHGHVYQMCDGLIKSGAVIKYVYDDDVKSVESFSLKFPTCKYVENADSIFSDNETDLIVCADIPNRRCDIGVISMRSGKDFFCAKAAMTTTEQLERIKTTCKETGRKFFIYYSEMVANKSALYAEKLIKCGKIGKVVNVIILAPHKLGENRPEWFFSREQSGGIITDIGSHQFYQFLRYTGNESAKITYSITANYSRIGEDFDDIGECCVRGDNGVTGYIRTDWLSPDSLNVFGDGRVFIVGTEGYIELRKYTDVGVSEEPDNVIMVNKNGVFKKSVFFCQDIDFFDNLLYDLKYRTEKAMNFTQSFAAMELALKAQNNANENRSADE